MRVRGELENAEREWLLTNGLGAYAMSTVALMHTRRYHGMLIASLEQPLGRYVILSHVDLAVHVGGRTHRLAVHQFPGCAPTPGYRYLDSYEQRPLPTWNYRIGEGLLQVTLALARRRNLVVFRLVWSGESPIQVTLRPLMPMRSHHDLLHEHGGMRQVTTMRSGAVEIQPVPGLPRVAFRHAGVFVGSPDWWRRFEYLEDRTRAAEFQEDLWTPGTFELKLEPNIPQWWEAGVGSAPTESSEEILADAADFWSSQDPGPGRSATERYLSVAAASFCATEAPEPGIVAGFPWLDVQVRDLLVALPGICLAPGKVSEAKSILRAVLRRMRGGWLPKWMPRRKDSWGSPCPEATLWLFHVVQRLRPALSAEDDFLAEIYPKLLRAFIKLAGKRSSLAWLTEEGLLANGAPGQSLTWMDSGQGEWGAVPRAGVAIEWQALWLRACETMAQLAQERGNVRIAQRAVSLAARVREAFPRRFWCRDRGYPCDVVSPKQGEDAWADPSVRPNALIALAIAPDLFEPWQATTLLDRARLELVTPGGVRTLSSGDSRFCGYYEGALEEREQATHQGTVWPMLSAWYVRAAMRNANGDDRLRAELRDYLTQVVEVGGALGHVAQLADGEPPHRWRGLPAHAGAVALLLDVLTQEVAPVSREVSGVSRSAGSV